jgi:hypothetical protein
MPYENIVFYKRLHLNIRRKRFIISTSDLLIEEFTKDLRKDLRDENYYYGTTK